MENDKQNQIKTITVNGKKHTLVHPGARWYLQTLDKSKNAMGVLMQEKYMQTLLNCCVAPTLTIEDFGDDLSKLYEVVKEIESFLGA